MELFIFFIIIIIIIITVIFMQELLLVRHCALDFYQMASLHAEASLQLQRWRGSKMTGSSNFLRPRKTENGRSLLLFNACSASYYVNKSVCFLRYIYIYVYLMTSSVTNIP
jgi:uncharacterized membrane protein YhaH (DUF805 family)